MDPSSNKPTGSAEADRSQSTGSIPTALLHPTLSRESTSSTATITPKTDSWPSKLTSQTSQTSTTSTSSSAAPSPLHSREPSPTRPPRQQRTSTSRASSINPGPRSRKNSAQDLGKQANPPPPPPPPPTTKTLSSTTPTLLPTVSNPSFNAGAPVKSPTSMEHIRKSPRWPVSPRLRSPPPILHQPNIPPQRRSEHETTLIALQRATPPQPRYQEPQSDTDTDDAHMPSGLRTPARGGGSSSVLETVQEVSPLGSQRGQGESLEEKIASSMASESSQADLIGLGLSKETVGRSNTGPNDSGSDSGSIKASRRGGSGMPPPPLTTRQSSTSINKPGMPKTKTGDLPLQSMTVETETVTSIPQAALAPSVGTQVSSASLRTKASNETIRPRKEKKKPPRKQPTVTAVNASSKADIFEAKVASAVEEANSSDSEETFVYDSNPPDARDRPPRFHSRTPSATSMVSQIDRPGMRSIHTVMESSGPQMVVKKSMKFVNTYNSNANDGIYGDDDGKGTGRSNAGSARGTARHHHHFGRWGRNGGSNGHPSLFAEHSPFSNAAAVGNGGSRHSSNPPSPRYANARNYSAANGKRSTHLSAGYDLDDNTTGADDETTPLVQSSTMRSSRSGRSRRGPHSHSYRSIEAQQYRSPPSVLNRFASCLVLTVMLLLIVSGAIGFMFATSQPLTNVQLTNMSHIVASQQELMLDLTIKAHNPNVVVVAVDSCNIEVFAKSPRGMSDSEWWRHTHPGEVGPPPIKRPEGEMLAMEADDDDDSAPNLHLGTITGFESPLTFEGSFFNQGDSYSTGEVRLKDPGNVTKPGGPERWERVLEDEFTLILKGVITYTLPLSQRERKATITAKKIIRPNSADDPAVQPDDGEVTISLIP
ncbi:uncharacterized protein PODANS_2_13160 [Podospora anserina S mat+]|uniref:Podospora anserina S mat+ genomic DNA chromosome 2, supercontig 2 n=1 Tax=Podospora anserina (strain S / ATCC MYA-4624 / DSM 980 / FGSC 10383) TaxID=515849 RepID=B2B834_PODAN|nr:uncharacterized protein PODANS_2_13160 [Podospora anserina S mat+]CAP73963.1 unnamed protein product [Podospora anserina S mat+]